MQAMVDRAIRRAALRWIGICLLAIFAVIALPADIWHSHLDDERLRQTGEHHLVTVTKVRKASHGRGDSHPRQIFFDLDGREQRLDAGEPDVGDRVDVVTGGGRLLLARDPGERSDAMFAVVAAPVLAVLAATWFGLGGRTPPLGALVAARAGRARRIPARVIRMQPIRAPRGRLYDWWRGKRGFVLLMLMPDGSSDNVQWVGPAGGRWRAGMPVTLIGGSAPGEWALLGAGGGKTPRSVTWPCRRLVDPGPAPAGPPH